MPIKKAAFRAMRKSRKNALRNKAINENIQYLLKQSNKYIGQKDAEKAKDFVTKTMAALDRAYQKNIFKKNTVARKKSRLMKKLNAMNKGK